MLSIFVSGIVYSSLIFVVASGLILALSALRIINLAHGSLYMLAAYLGYSLLTIFPNEPAYFLLALGIDFVALAVLGGLIEISLLRRIYRAVDIQQLVLTFGLVWIFQDVVRGVWGVSLRSFSPPEFMSESLTFLGCTFSVYNLLIFIVAIIVGVGLWGLLAKTNAGMIIRAITNNADMTNCLGINVPLWRTLIFGLSCGLAGVGGALVIPWASLSLGMDWKILMDLCIVIVIGGMGSFAGAVVGAFILGQVNAFGILVLPKFAMVFGFIAMAIVLLIRPSGLFGKPE